MMPSLLGPLGLYCIAGFGIDYMSNLAAIYPPKLPCNLLGVPCIAAILYV